MKAAKQVMVGMVMAEMVVVMVMMVVASKQVRSQGESQNHIKVGHNIECGQNFHVFELEKKRLPSAVREGRLRLPKLLHLVRPQSKVTVTPLELNPPKQEKVETK